MRPLLALLATLLLVISVGANASSLQLVPLFPSLRFQQPAAMVQLPGGETPRWLVVEKRGTIQLVEGRGVKARSGEFADLHDRIEATPTEAGLLGIALHPQFEKNHTLFLSYTRSGAPLVSIVARFKITADGKHIDPNSAQTTLELAQPYSNHNGGGIGSALMVIST